jgi:hypothetical protein
MNERQPLKYVALDRWNALQDIQKVVTNLEQSWQLCPICTFGDLKHAEGCDVARIKKILREVLP